MAECHPVGFQWVMEAKARGATVVHVDPRFTRTSALSDLHVPIRAGADIVFLGGIINYVLTHEKYFRDYVLAYTNAATLLTEDFADTEDLDGVFSGLDREHRAYDFEAWRYQGADVAAAAGQRDRPDDPDDPEDSGGSDDEDHGPAHQQVRRAARGEAHGAGGARAHRNPDRDETLTSPRCVFQVLKRHFARYTPDMVQQACGVPPDVFTRVCELVTENSGPDRTTAFVYSVGWTQHTVGAQYIRTAAILQLLLGNIGRPGGGILALRGHASIQGSTDIPTRSGAGPGRPTGGSCTTAPPPTPTASRGATARRLVWWDADAGKWAGHDVPDFVPDRAPSYRPAADATGVDAISGVDPFILQADGKGWLFAPAGLVDGPLPAHYEPQESPFTNPLYGQQRNPVREIIRHRQNPYQPVGDQPGAGVFPYVATTYRLTEHHTAGGMSRMLPYLSELQPEFFCEVSPELAAERGLSHLGWATIITARTAIEARVLVTERIRTIEVQGRRLHQIGLPYHWGANGISTGDSANDLAHLSLDPNVHIQEVKALACDIQPGRRPRGPALRQLVREYAERAGITDETGTEI